MLVSLMIGLSRLVSLLLVWGFVRTPLSYPATELGPWVIRLDIKEIEL